MKKSSELDSIDLNRHYILEASAGTGKTYSMIYLTMRLLTGRSKGKPIDLTKILIVTYTEKSTAEMKQRLREAIDQQLVEWQQQNLTAEQQEAEKNLLKAKRDFESAAIFTIHAFCKQILQKYSIQNNLLTNHEVVEDFPIYQSQLDEIKRIDWNEEFGENLADLLYIESYDKDWDRNIINAAIKIWPEADPIVLPEISSELHNLPFLPKVEEKIIVLQEIYSKNQKIFQEIYNKVNKEGGKKKNVALFMKSTQPIIEKLIMGDFRWPHLVKIFDSLKERKEFQENGGGIYSESFLPTVLDMSPKKVLQTIYPILKEIYNLTDWQAVRHLLKIYTINCLKERVREYKQAGAQISFDDMITKLYHLLVTDDTPLADELAEQYQYVFIDEFQDTDFVQWQIFYHAFVQTEKPRLFLIGDPKQAIYSFRNADVMVYDQALHTMMEQHAAIKYPLDTNYRSCQPLITGLNKIFSQEWFTKSDAIKFTIVKANTASAKPYVDSSPRAAVNAVVFGQWQSEPKKNKQYNTILGALDSNIHYNQFIAKEIQQLVEKQEIMINGKPISYSDICILIRNKNQLEALEQQLDSRQIPYNYYKKEGIYQSDEALHLFSLLSAILYPHSRQNLHKGLLTDFFSLTLQQLEELADRVLPESVEQLLVDWQELAVRKDWSVLFSSVLEDTGLVYRCIKQGMKGSRKLSIYRQLMERLEDEAYSTNAELFSLLETFKKWQESIIELEEKETLYKIDSEQKMVKILTIHKSKGLEFPIVFVVPNLSRGLGSDIYHKFHNEQKRIVFDFCESHKDDAKKESIAEDERLYYVALTRAKFKVYFPCLLPIDRRGWSEINSLLHDPVKKIIDMSQNEPEIQCIEHSFDPLQEEIRSIAQVEQTEEKEWSRSPITFELQKKSDFWSRIRKVNSYTSLKNEGSKNVPIEKYDIKNLLFDEAETINIAENILPGSRYSGILLHEILEELDFSQFCRYNSLSQLKVNRQYKAIVNMIFRRYKNDILELTERTESEILKEIAKMVWRAISIPLQKDWLALKEIACENYLKEVDFLFQQKIAAKARWVTGSIDMVLRIVDKYYILDWKTDSMEEYSQETMHKRVLESGYDKQYNLYSYGLYLWLQQAVGETMDMTTFIQEKLGGVLYVFLRGLDKKGNGIYFIDNQQLHNLAQEIESIFGGSDVA